MLTSISQRGMGVVEEGATWSLAERQGCRSEFILVALGAQGEGEGM